MASNKKSQAGIVSVLLMLLIVIITAGVGVYVWQNRAKQSADFELSQPSQGQNEIGTKVVAVGDISCEPGVQVTATECQMQKIVDAIVSEKPTHVFALGDLQYDVGSPDAFEQSFGPLWSPLREITYAAPGNHEYGTKNAAGYFGYWNGADATSKQAGETGKGYYSTNFADWHIVSLNSNCSEVGGCDAQSEQGKWLASDVSTYSLRCTLAFWHHPRFTSGRHTNAVNTSYFWEALYANRADVVLNGHDHLYERFAKQKPTGELDATNGIREFVAGAGGRSLYKFNKTLQPNHEVGNDSQFGYLVMTLYKSSYSWEYKTLDGQVVDQGSSACNR